MNYEYAGKGRIISEFDLYIPALLVLAIIMMLFTAGASIVREIEKDTITRLTFSDISFELIWIIALAIVYFLIGTWLFRRKYKY